MPETVMTAKQGRDDDEPRRASPALYGGTAVPMRGTHHPALVIAVALTLLFSVTLPIAGVAHHDEGTPSPQSSSVGGQAAPALAPPVDISPLSIDGDPIVRIVPAPPDAGAIYVVGQAELYRTTDGGQRWEEAGPLPPAGRLIAAQNSRGFLLAGSHPPCARGGGEIVDLSRSDDGGATWQPVRGETGLEPLAIWAEAKLAIAANCAGLRISGDIGETWTDLPILPPGSEVTAFTALTTEDPGQQAALLATTSEGGTSRLFRLGLADPNNPVLSDPLIEYWGLGSLTGDDDRYVLGAATGVWLSDDRGATWTPHRDGLEAVTISVDPLVATEPIPDEELQRGFGIDALAADPASVDRLYAGTVGGLFTSGDAGATWEQVAGVEARVTTLVLAPTGGRLFAETPSGVIEVPLQP